MYICWFFSAPLFSLSMNHIWLSSHDEYSETHSDNGYYLQVISLYRSVLLSKCTSVDSSLHPCLPLVWIISDCLLMMSIQRYMKTPTSLLQVIPLYISKLLSKCTSVDILTSADHSCLSMKVWWVSMKSIRDCIKPYLTLYRSFPLYKVSSGLTLPLLSPKFLSSAHSYHTSPKIPLISFRCFKGTLKPLSSLGGGGPELVIRGMAFRNLGTRWTFWFLS